MQFGLKIFTFLTSLLFIFFTLINSLLFTHFHSLALSSLLSKCNVTLFCLFFFFFFFTFSSLSLSSFYFPFFLSHNLSPSYHYLPRPLSLSLSLNQKTQNIHQQRKKRLKQILYSLLILPPRPPHHLLY